MGPELVVALVARVDGQEERLRIAAVNRDRDAEAAGVVGDALRMVAGRHGDHAALALLRRELEQGIQRAALLERGGELKVLELDPDIGLGDARQRLAAQAGRVDNGAGDARGGALDIVQGDGEIGHRAHAARTCNIRGTQWASGHCTEFDGD